MPTPTTTDPSIQLPGETDIEYWTRQYHLAEQLPDTDFYFPDTDPDTDDLSAILKPPQAVPPKALQYAHNHAQGMWDPSFMKLNRLWSDPTNTKGWVIEFTPTQGDRFQPQQLAQFYHQGTPAHTKLNNLTTPGRNGKPTPPYFYTDPTNTTLIIGTPERQWSWRNTHFHHPGEYATQDDWKQCTTARNTMWFFLRGMGLSPKLLDPTPPDNQFWDPKTLGAALNQDTLDTYTKINKRIDDFNKENKEGKPLKHITPPKPIKTRPTVVGAGACEEGIYLDVAPAEGSTLSAQDMGKINLPIIQRELHWSNVTAALSDNGMYAHYIVHINKPEDPAIASSWTPDNTLMPRGGGQSVAHAIRAGQKFPRIPLGSSLPAQEIFWIDFQQTPHMAVLGGTASGKSWALLSWITAWGGNFLGQQMVVIDGKKSGDFNLLLKPEIARSSGVQAVASTPYEAFALLKWIEAEFVKRTSIQSQMKKNGLLDMQFPRLICVIDEIAYLLGTWEKKVSDEASKTIDQLLKAARGVGIHLILCAQNPRDTDFPNKWLANVGLRVSMGKSDFPMVQRKVLGTSLDDFPEAKSFVAGGMKGRGVMKMEDPKRGEIVTAFRSSHSWSPSKPLSASGGADWESEKRVFSEKRCAYTRRFGFRFSDDMDPSKPEELVKGTEVVFLDDERFQPLEDMRMYDPSHSLYEEWSPAGGSGLRVYKGPDESTTGEKGKEKPSPQKK